MVAEVREQADEVADPSRRGGLVRPAAARPGGRLLPLAASFLVYLALSVLIWWGAWSGGPASHTVCSCGDPAIVTWFLAWPAHAISHGLNPFYSTFMLHPRGVNLLSNPSALAAGVPLAPVTWLFGPNVTAAVANTLGPALDGVSMAFLLTRWVKAFPAAFVGGLLYGFSPFVFTDMAGSYISLSWLFVLPLMVACLDELLVRQERPPLRVGALLGLLATLQFFIATEILFTALLTAVAGLIVLLAGGLLADRAATVGRLKKALPGLGVAAGVSAVLLAYPLYFALDGPGSLKGAVWLHTLALAGNAPRSLFHLGYYSERFAGIMRHFGGYQGHVLPRPAGLGPLLVLVLLGGWAVFWRDRRLLFFGLLGAVTTVLSFGVTGAAWTPWRLVESLPVFENVIPGRFSIFVDLCAAVMLAVVLDRAHRALAGRDRRYPRRLLAGGATVGLAALALVPIALLEAPDVPLTLERVTAPRWFDEAAGRLPPGQVVLSYPPFSTQANVAWNTAAGISYAMAGGGGPTALPARAGRERPGAELLTRESWPFVGPPVPLTAANIAAVRRALSAWGVTKVVVPDQPGLPAYARGRPVGVVSAFFTGVLGEKPARMDGSLVWSIGRPGG